MPSPFPGMDPYLENPEIFPDLHDSLITYHSGESPGESAASLLRRDRTSRLDRGLQAIDRARRARASCRSCQDRFHPRPPGPRR